MSFLILAMGCIAEAPNMYGHAAIVWLFSAVRAQLLRLATADARILAKTIDNGGKLGYLSAVLLTQLAGSLSLQATSATARRPFV